MATAKYKWRKAGELTTKEEISKAADVSTTNRKWAEEVASSLIIVPNTLVTFMSIAISLTGTSAAVFYKKYETALKNLLEEIEKLSAKTSFYVEQRYKWHPGQRGWMPLASFRVVKQ